MKGLIMSEEEKKGLEAMLEGLADEEDDGEERYVLTPWGCLYSVLTDYGIDVEHVPGRVGQHIVDDFMDAMVKAGHVIEHKD